MPSGKVVLARTGPGSRGTTRNLIPELPMRYREAPSITVSDHASEIPDLLAVAVGFEPTEGLPLTRFRGVLLRPLGHATAGADYPRPRRAPRRKPSAARRHSSAAHPGDHLGPVVERAGRARRPTPSRPPRPSGPRPRTPPGRPGPAPARRRTSCTAPASPPACSRPAASCPSARAAPAAPAPRRARSGRRPPRAGWRRPRATAPERVDHDRPDRHVGRSPPRAPAWSSARPIHPSYAVGPPAATAPRRGLTATRRAARRTRTPRRCRPARPPGRRTPRPSAGPARPR